MKIYLLDINDKMTEAWTEAFNPYFENKNNPVCVVNEDFVKFMNSHPEIDTIVSPANSYGLMDGGYDAAITNYFGSNLMKDVQKEIIKEWHGEQPVGTSLSVVIHDNNDEVKFAKGEDGKYSMMMLIHTPTMRTPEKIVDPRIVYQCMRTTLMEAIFTQAKIIVIPAFGGQTGGLSHETIAKMMVAAYEQIFVNSIKSIDWSVAFDTSTKLKEIMKWQRSL